MVEPLTDKELKDYREWVAHADRSDLEDAIMDTTVRQQRRILATIARLQERVEEAERQERISLSMVELGLYWEENGKDVKALLRQLAEAGALAERRKKDILKSGEGCRYCGRWHHFGCRHLELSSRRLRCPRYPCSVRCKDARAAIEEKA